MNIYNPTKEEIEQIVGMPTSQFSDPEYEGRKVQFYAEDYEARHGIVGVKRGRTSIGLVRESDLKRPSKNIVMHTPWWTSEISLKKKTVRLDYGDGIGFKVKLKHPIRYVRSCFQDLNKGEVERGEIGREGILGPELIHFAENGLYDRVVLGEGNFVFETNVESPFKK